MQRPHDHVLEKNPAFADLYPRLDATVKHLLSDPADHALKYQLAKTSQLWTKLRIMWDEVQLLLIEPENANFAASLEQHVARTTNPELYASELSALKIPEDRTFPNVPPNLQQRLDILSDMLAVRLNEKLSRFNSLEEGDRDLLALGKAREANITQLKQENKELMRILTELSMELGREGTESMKNQMDYLEKIKHGSIEQFIHAYITFHDVASLAFLQKAEQRNNQTISSIYTPAMNRALEAHDRYLKAELPKVEAKKLIVDKEIERYEQLRTPEYVDTAEEHQRLKNEIAQAERDIEQLSQYKLSA